MRSGTGLETLAKPAYFRAEKVPDKRDKDTVADKLRSTTKEKKCGSA